MLIYQIKKTSEMTSRCAFLFYFCSSPDKYWTEMNKFMIKNKVLFIGKKKENDILPTLAYSQINQISVGNKFFL